MGEHSPQPTSRELSDLAWLAEERMIMDRSHWWPRIAQWQRRGWVRLRWEGKRCYVQATEAGREAANVGA
jgi:hypothetical protein